MLICLESFYAYQEILRYFALSGNTDQFVLEMNCDLSEDKKGFVSEIDCDLSGEYLVFITRHVYARVGCGEAAAN